MLIRNAIKKDLHRICLLADQINQLHHANEPKLFSKPEISLADSEFWEAKVVSDETLTLVSEVDEVVHGFVLATLTAVPVAPFLEKNRVCRINTIVVSEDKQKLGLGKSLFSEVENWAKKQGVAEVRLEVVEFNKVALAFYEKLGFRTQSRILSNSVTR